MVKLYANPAAASPLAGYARRIALLRTQRSDALSKGCLATVADLTRELDELYAALGSANAAKSGEASTLTPSADSISAKAIR